MCSFLVNSSFLNCETHFLFQTIKQSISTMQFTLLGYAESTIAERNFLKIKVMSKIKEEISKIKNTK